MRQRFYRQCVLESGPAQLVAWIEEASAKVGAEVALKDHGGPDRWWEVVSVGSTRLSEEVAERRQRESLKLQKKLA